MAHLWTHDEKLGWVALRLEGNAVTLTGEDPPVRSVAVSHHTGVAMLVPFRRSGSEGKWALIRRNGGRIAVNGSLLPMTTGLKVLKHCDELRVIPGTVHNGNAVDACRLYFSTESLAQPVPFPGAARRMVCPRCKQEITQGTTAVRCPGDGCGRWYHQTDELPCWTYSETCTFCPQKTAFDVGFSFTPDGL